MVNVSDKTKDAILSQRMREIGRLGGQKTRDKYGVEFFSKIGTKSAELQKKRKEEQNG